MSIDPVVALDALLTDLEREFPRFRIAPKSKSRLSRLIDLALRIVTLGRQDRFMTEYHTVIGDTLYVPESWPATSPIARLILLRHERVHLRQRRRLGTLWMAFLYLVPFVPLGLAYGRARLEWEAYRETLRATAEYHGLDALTSPTLRERIVSRFLGPDYGWMWPFRSRVQSWYQRAVDEIETEFRPANQDPEA